MKQNKKLKVLIIILLIIVILPIAVITFFYLLSFSMVFGGFLIGHITAPIPDIPKIRYAEFPYEIVYSTAGEIHTANGIYVCEYDGVETEPSSMGQTKVLAWKTYVSDEEFEKANCDEDIPLFLNDNLEVYLEIGEPGYYMGQRDVKPIDKPELVCYVISEETRKVPQRAGESFREVCDVEIISYELPTPIENTFVPKKWYEFWK